MSGSAPTPVRQVGLFVLLGLILIALLLINFSKGASLLSPGWNLTVQSDNVGGLKPGAPVMMSGVPIGHVKTIVLSADGRAVLINCRIHKKYSVHADAKVDLEQSGFLGDQFISIVPTANAGRKLEDGALLKCPPPFNLQDAARSAVTLMNRLDSAASKIDSAVDRVDKVLLSESTLRDITATVSNFRTLSVDASAALADVKGLVQSNSSGIGSSISNFNVFSEKLSRLGDRVADVTTQVNLVLGNVNTLVLTNQSQIAGGLADLRASASGIREITEGINRGQGLVGGLLKDEQLHRQFNHLVVNLDTLSSNLSKYGILYKPKEARPVPFKGSISGRSGFN